MARIGRPLFEVVLILEGAVPAADPLTHDASWRTVT
jgi:hypothetical protein